MKSLTGSPLLLSTVAVLLLVPAAGRAAAPAYESNPDFIKARDQAKQLAGQGANIRFAVDAWRKANKIAGGHCMECFVGIIKTSNKLGEFKDSARAAAEMDAAATTPEDHSTAEIYLGYALMGQSGREKPKPDLLEQAHAAFTKAFANDSTNTMALYEDGMALALLNRDAEASAAFTSFAAKARPSDALRVRAEHMAANPAMVHQKMAPSFAVTTLAGNHFNLDDMGGRVVLIDFWATWCGPCNQELPHMQKLAAKYANDPFEIVSISWDSDEGKWRSFIDAHGMKWEQYRDADHKLSTAFGVNAIPHYFTIDSDGVLSAENVGSGSMADSRIEKLVKRAREARAQAAAAVPVARPGQ